MDRARSARFSTSIETKRWWHGEPELAQAFLEVRGRTLLLGLGMARRRFTGYAATGLQKPHLYHAATRILYYDFSESGNVHGVSHTFRRMRAYAEGLRQSPRSSVYHLPLGGIREVSRTRISPTQFEVLEVECANANLGDMSDPRLFCRSLAIKQKAWKEYLRAHPPVRKYIFRIVRVNSHDATTRLGNGMSFEIPADAVISFFDRINQLIEDFWVYLQEHPEQVDLRYDCLKKSEQRWQLHYPKGVDAFMPRRAYIFSDKLEDALFTHADVYEGDCPRLTSAGRFHPLYRQRLWLFFKGVLRWAPSWTVSQERAEKDVQLLAQRTAERRARQRGLGFGLDVLVITNLAKLLFRYLPPVFVAKLGFRIYVYFSYSPVPYKRHVIPPRQRGPP